MKRFQVLDDEFINTGGNCMVHTTTVYDHEAKSTRFVLVCEESIVLSTADMAKYDFDYEQCVLTSIAVENLVACPDWSNTECNELTYDEWVLFKDCQFKYVENYCKYFNTRFHMTADEFPTRLLEGISAECIEWHKENDQLFSTDGTDCKPSEYYDEHAVMVRKFYNYLVGMPTDDDSWYEALEQEFTISHNGHECKVAFTPIIFEGLQDLLNDYMCEYID